MHRFYVEFTWFLHFLKLIWKSVQSANLLPRLYVFWKIMLKKRKKTKNPEYPLKTKVFSDIIFMYIYEYKGDSLWHNTHYVVDGSFIFLFVPCCLSYLPISLLPFGPAPALNPLRRPPRSWSSYTVLLSQCCCVQDNLPDARGRVPFRKSISRRDVSDYAGILCLLPPLPSRRDFSSPSIYFSGPAVSRSLSGKYFPPWSSVFDSSLSKGSEGTLGSGWSELCP